MIVLQKFSSDPEKPNGGSVASYLQQTARTQAERLKEALAADGDDPVRAEYTRAHGPCPEDEFDKAYWHIQLEKFRADRGAVASA